MPNNKLSLSALVLASSVVQSESLIPLNPSKLSGFIASCAVQSNPKIQPNNVMQTVENLEQTLEYLDSAHNMTHRSDRLGKVLFDTAVVNAGCEIPGALGTIFAGSYANQMAEQYTNEIVEDELAKSMETQFSCELRLRGGPGSKNNSTGYDTPYKPFLFGGVGIFGQNANENEKKMLSPNENQPRPRGGRPLWSYKFFGKNGAAFIFIMPNGDIVIRFPTEKIVQKIIFKGFGSQVLKCGTNFLLLANYIKYAMFIKKLIAIYGIKYVNLFKNTCIKLS